MIATPHPTSSDHIELVTQERFELQRRRSQSAHTQLFDLLDAVHDPEIPVISIWDLGILQDIQVRYLDGEQQITVTITPTYSGCPAMQQISEDIVSTLDNAGFRQVNVEQQLVPAWSTDWMTQETRRRLRNYGIAPPEDSSCPQCGSNDVTVISDFGSTSCKALMRCNTCLEPFDQFKRL